MTLRAGNVRNCFCCCRHADLEQPLDEAIMARAKRFVLEWKLVAEGRRLNLQRGLAIPTRMLLHAARAQGDCLPKCTEYHQSMSPFGNAADSGRVWAHRFRQRWNARIGKIRLAEPIAVAGMHVKVLGSFCCAVIYVAYCFRHGSKYMWVYM